MEIGGEGLGGMLPWENLDFKTHELDNNIGLKPSGQYYYVYLSSPSPSLFIAVSFSFPVFIPFPKLSFDWNSLFIAVSEECKYRVSWYSCLIIFRPVVLLKAIRIIITLFIKLIYDMCVHFAEI